MQIVIVVWSLSPAQLFSTPWTVLLRYLPEFAQTQVHWVSDAIQPSHPLLPPFPPALNLFQYQSLSSELALRIR